LLEREDLKLNASRDMPPYDLQAKRRSRLALPSSTNTHFAWVCLVHHPTVPKPRGGEGSMLTGKVAIIDVPSFWHLAFALLVFNQKVRRFFLPDAGHFILAGTRSGVINPTKTKLISQGA
jgi:hypothetical protein